MTSPAVRSTPVAADAGTAPTVLKAAVRAGSATDNVRNWWYVGGDAATAAAAVAAGELTGSWPVRVLAVVVIGSRMRAAANLVHEAAHRKLFRRRVLNDVVGTVCAWLVLIDFRAYRRAHRRHHQRLWSADDPDLALYRSTGTEYGSAPRSPTAFVVRHVVLAVVPVQPWVRLARETRAAPLRLAALAGVAGAAVALVAAGAPGPGSGVLLYWVVPWLTSYQTIAYWAELGEHGGLRGLGRAWGTRNWQGGPVSRWLVGSHSDDPFHLLHHCFPSVPHYRLAEVDAVAVAAWPDYAGARRCAGFFLGCAGRRSVLRDMYLG